MRNGSQARSAADLKIRMAWYLGLHFASVLELGHFLFQIVYSFLGLQCGSTSGPHHNARGEGGKFPGYSDNIPEARARNRREHDAKEKENIVEARSVHCVFPSSGMTLGKVNDPQSKALHCHAVRRRDGRHNLSFSARGLAGGKVGMETSR
jgi:hypothetical protein